MHCQANTTDNVIVYNQLSMLLSFILLFANTNFLFSTMPVLVSSWHISVSFQGIQLWSWCSSKSSCKSNEWELSSTFYFLASLSFFSANNWCDLMLTQMVKFKRNIKSSLKGLLLRRGFTAAALISIRVTNTTN